MVVRPTTNGGMDLSVGTRRGCMAHNNWLDGCPITGKNQRI